MRVGPPYEFGSMGIGFTIMLLVMGAIREVLGSGSFLGVPVMAVHATTRSRA